MRVIDSGSALDARITYCPLELRFRHWILIMNDWIKVAAYNAWLLQMNMKGYGTCDQIDKMVSNGELTPGKEYIYHGLLSKNKPK